MECRFRDTGHRRDLTARVAAMVSDEDRRSLLAEAYRRARRKTYQSPIDSETAVNKPSKPQDAKDAKKEESEQVGEV